MSAHAEIFDNAIVFFGGVLLSLTHPFHSTVFLLDVSPLSIATFVLRSLIGGALALLGKLGVEWRIKKFRAKNQKQQ